MKKQVSVFYDFIKGLWNENPTTRQLLGMCPTLAVTTSAMNGVGMASATTFVLIFSSIFISLVRKLIPNQVRIAAYVVIIATFVTIVDIYMKAKLPALYAQLGIFIPLIVVNCIILGRAEAFAAKNTVFRSFIDALGMGVGFTISLTLLGSIREVLGSGTLFGMQVMPAGVEPWIVMVLPPGAFITLGLILGSAKMYEIKKKRKALSAQIKSHSSLKLGQEA